MRIGTGLALVGSSLALAAGAVRAELIVVDTELDPPLGSCAGNLPSLPIARGTCSLRAAIQRANDTQGSDLILFAPAVFGTEANRVITLQAPLPDVVETVEINATSPPLLGQRVQGIVLRAGSGVTEILGVSAGSAQLDDLTLEGGDLRIDAGRLVLLQSVDAEFAESITGAGSLQKEGAARLTLTGVNSYGNTFLEEGTLQGDTASIPGAGRTVTDDGILVFDQETSDAPDFLGAITGSGSLRKIGAGTLYLRTANSYSGGTTVSEGTLQGFADGSITPGSGSLQGNIVNDATLIFDQQSDGAFAGSISGSGSVEKTGSSNGTPTELLLTGSNRYTGGTTIREGILRGDADAIPGSVAIGSGAQLVFDEAGSGTNGGALTGGGGLASGLFSVEKRGAGTLTLSGLNSYAGGSWVSGGTLRGDSGSLRGDILLAPGTTLVFDQGSAGVYAGQLGGTGTLQKAGSGTLLLTRDLALPGVLGSPFSGSTAITGGRLNVGDATSASARLPGDVRIENGAFLGGIGTLEGTATARSGATISPGSSIGTLRVGGASFESGSFFEVEIAPPVGSPPVSSADLLAVAGTATIAPGTKVRVIPSAGDYPDQDPDAPVAILTAMNIEGAFDPIPPDTFAFLDASLTQTSTQVLLTVESNGKQLDDFAGSENQRAVAEALEAARVGGDEDLDTVFGELNAMLAADIPDALDAMAGEQLTQFATARLAVGDRFHASVQERIRDQGAGEREMLLSGSGTPPLAASPLLLAELGGGRGSALGAGLAQAAFAMQQRPALGAPEPAPRGLGGWLDGYGLFGSVSGGSGTSDFDSTIWGVSAGLDARLAERWVVGVAGGWAHSELDFDGLSRDPQVQTAQGAAYAGYVSPLVEAGAAFRFGWNRMSSDRDISFAAPSTLSRSAESKFDGIDLGGHAEAAFNLFEAAGIAIQPLASLRYTHLEQDAFDESGAGSLDLSADKQEIDSVVSGLGLRLHALFDLGDGFWIRPELRGRWLHEFGDRERTLDTRIGGLPGASYGVRGTELPRDTGTVGLGWTVASSGLLYVFAEYDLAVNPDLLQHSAAIGFRVVW